jgi:hypothetical protein
MEKLKSVLYDLFRVLLVFIFTVLPPVFFIGISIGAMKETFSDGVVLKLIGGTIVALGAILCSVGGLYLHGKIEDKFNL